MDGLDSVFYSFKTVRPNPVDTSSYCQFIKGPNWYGDHVVIKANGENLFFNQNLDTIHIQTQAQLGETFIFYVYPDLADTIFATVVNKAQVTILGQLDSVKYLELSSTSTLPFAPNQLSLSKHHGIIANFSAYSFPNNFNDPSTHYLLSNYDGNFNLVGTEFPRVGITRPRHGEIYDFEIGDYIIFSHGYDGYTGPGYWEHNYVERTILDKIVYGLGPDSIDYLIYDTIHTIAGDNSFGNIVLVNTTSGNQYTKRYKNLANPKDEFLPEEYTGNEEYEWNILRVNSCGRVEEISYNFLLGEGFGPSSPCLTNNFFESQDLLTSYISGLGNQEKSGMEGEPYPDMYYSEISYYSKVTEDTCGNITYMTLPEQSTSTTSIQIFPNPADDFVIIQTENDQNVYSELQLLDATGKLIRSESLKDSNLIQGHTLSTNELQPGIYFLIVRSEDRQAVFKLVRK